jgi:hypothetical protein
MSLKNSINKLRQAMAASLNMNEGPSETESLLPISSDATEISSMDCDNCCVYNVRQLLDGTIVYAVRCGRPPNMTRHYIRTNGRSAVEATGCRKPLCSQRTNP